MKIVWESLGEIKDFLELVNIEKLSNSEQNWGGLGYIIDDGKRSDCIVTEIGESKVINSGDKIIITPKSKELSWLFRNLYECTTYGILPSGILLDAFWAACLGFFINHQQYESKELLLFVIKFIEDCIKDVQK